MAIMKIIALVFALATSSLAAPSAVKLHHPSTRIVGGADAERGEFPYQVSYQQILPHGWAHFCGGSVLNENWILLAANCIFSHDFDEFRIVAGILNLDDGDDVETKQVRAAKRHVVHENYPGGVGPNDIALIELTEPLTWNEAVQPIPLGDCEEVDEGDAVLSGWGYTIPGAAIIPNTLQKTALPILPNSECKEALDAALGEKNDAFDYDSNMCTGPLEGGTAACHADSGGPLVLNGTLVGIASWSISPCGQEGVPSVFTKVANFCGWIDEQLNVTAT